MHLVGKYGIKFLDDKLKGIFNTELVIIGAHTGIGKSTLANMIALNLASQGVKPALLSLENFKGDMILKETFKQWKQDNAPSNPQLWGVDFRDWLAQYGDAPQAAGDSYKKITQKFKNMLIVERPEGAFTIDTLEKYFKDAANQGCGCVILDHLDYLDYLNASENDISHVRAIMGKIRELQTEFQIPVIAFSQFRKGISQDVKIPSYEELYGSGDKAKQAVVVIVLARDNENQLYADDVSPTFMAIRKDRYGDYKACRVMYNLKTQNYTDDYQNLKVNFWGTEIKEL